MGRQGCPFRFPYGGGFVPPHRGGGTDGGGQRSDGGGLAHDSRQSRELKKLAFQMLKKRLFVKQNHFIG